MLKYVASSFELKLPGHGFDLIQLYILTKYIVNRIRVNKHRSVLLFIRT